MAQEAQGYPGYQGYGGYGQAMDPASMRARLAMAMMQQGSESTPIRSPWQGAARMSNALFGALMMRQMQDSQASSWQKALAGMPTGGGLTGGGGVSGGEGSPGLPAQPGALADLANDPDVMRGIANAGTNGLPDSATIGASMQRGAFPPQMGPPMPGMAPNNSAGGMPPGYIGGGGGPGSIAPNMTAALPASMQHNMMVAGPGAPSQVPPLPPSGPASGNGPQGAGAGTFNPQDLAMFQQDMQAVPGMPLGGGGGPPGGGEVGQYIAQRAASMGIDPNVALRVARSEGLNATNPGDGGSSFGPFQLHYGGINSAMPHPGLGDAFTKATGLDARDPSTWKQQVDFALSQAKQGGWGPWSGAKAQGITGFAGIGGGGGGNNFAQNSVAGPGAPSGQGGGSNMFAQDMQGIPGGLASPQSQSPASMQHNMQVAGPGAPSTGNRFTGMNAPMPPPGALGPPPGGGVGNPLAGIGSGLQNMFGLANPSGPQGGNGPAPAGGGAGGQVDPRMRQLMEVISDPYAAPGAKQVAMQFLQYYMPHPTTWETMPGTNNLAEKNWMGQFTGRQMPGPHRTSVVDAGTDFMGVKHQGILDEDAPLGKQITVIDPNNPSGGTPAAPPPPSPTGSSVTVAPPNSVPPGNIPPPNPAWMPGASSSPGIAGPVPSPADWTKGLDAQQTLIMQNPGKFSGTLAMVPAAQLPDVMNTARAIVEGRQQPYAMTGVGPTKPIEQATMEAVRALDPAYTSTRYDSVKDFNGSTQGSTGGQLTQGRTGIGHLRQAMDLSQQLNQNQGGIGNMPVVGPIYNEFYGNQKQKDIAGAYTEAVTKANSELTRFYLGAPGSAGEREEGLRNELSANANPDVRTKALKELAELANSKIEKLQERWHAGTGGNMPDYPILQPADQDNFKYTQSFGRLGSGQGQPPPSNASGGAQAAPAPSAEVPAGQWHAGGAPSNPVVPAPAGAQSAGAPPVPGAVRGSRGNWLIPNPAKPGTYLQVTP